MPVELKQLIHVSQIAAHKTLSVPESPLPLLRHTPREKRGVGMRMCTKLEHLLFRCMWETYFCVRFQNRNDRLKPFK
jgi:hypothetical protein